MVALDTQRTNASIILIEFNNHRQNHFAIIARLDQTFNSHPVMLDENAVRILHTLKPHTRIDQQLDL